MRRTAMLLLAVALVGLLGSSCTTGTPRRVPKGSVPGAAAADGAQWHECAPVECATLSVPLDVAKPSAGHITLAIARHRATGDRIGALLTNPGGPGAAGLWLAQQAEDIFPSTILEHFDIVAWDPRGTGESTPVDCNTHLDRFWGVDRTPDNAKEIADNVAVSKAFAASCEARSARLLPFMGSTHTADDMDAIRRALGDTKISYLGFSYGTYIGSLYAAKYPTHVRAMVLDGAVDPALSSDAAGEQQAQGFEGALDAFLADCSAKTSCAFHSGGDAKGAFDRLVQQIDAEPLFAQLHGETRSLGPGETDLGVAEAMYGGRATWPKLASALAAAAGGNGSKLLALSDEYTEREAGGVYSNQTAAFYATGCVDAPEPGGLAAIEAEAARAARVAPHFGASTIWLGLPCAYWPVRPKVAPAPIHAPGAPPILVLGTTHDPATPFAWAQHLASELDSGHLVALDDEGHTAYGRGSACIDDIVHAYLLQLTVPKAGITCH